VACNVSSERFRRFRPPPSSGSKSKLSLPPASVGFLLGLLFDPEDGGTIFWLTSGSLRTTRRYNPDDYTLHKEKV
jgi:hypothetical protein